MHDQINCNERVLPALLHLRCPSQSHQPTFSPWTHTSDDSYIYQLSLVLATATYCILCYHCLESTPRLPAPAACTPLEIYQQSPSRLCSRDGKICCYGDALSTIFLLDFVPCFLLFVFRFSFLFFFFSLHPGMFNFFVSLDLCSIHLLLSGRVLTSSKPLGALGMEQYFMASLTAKCC